MGAIIEIILYAFAALVLVFWLIPMALYMWGSMFMKGVIERYFEFVNKNKNGKKEEE